MGIYNHIKAIIMLLSNVMASIMHFFFLFRAALAYFVKINRNRMSAVALHQLHAHGFW